MNVLEGGFSITSQMNNAIYNHGGAFNGNNISFSASTGSSGSGAALKLAIGTVIGLNASVINDRSKPAVEVESGSVEITGGSYPANGSPDGALYVGGTVTLKGGTFSNTSFLSKAISVGTNITYASLLEKGCGYTADNGTTFLTDENAIGAATSLTVKAVPAPSAHTHAVSVGCETDSGAQVEFQPLPDMSASNSSGYTLAGGSYYLTANAAVGGSLTINGNVTLCLNGYTLSFSGGTEIEGNASAAISVPRGSSLSVCDCGQSKGKIAYQAGGPRGHAAIGGAGDVTLYGCAVEISKTSDYVANGLYNAGGIFTLYDSHVSATHTISGSDKTPFATAIDGRPGSTTFIHGGSLSATVRNGTAYTDGKASITSGYAPSALAWTLPGTPAPKGEKKCSTRKRSILSSFSGSRPWREGDSGLPLLLILVAGNEGNEQDCASVYGEKTASCHNRPQRGQHCVLLLWRYGCHQPL